MTRAVQHQHAPGNSVDGQPNVHSSLSPDKGQPLTSTLHHSTQQTATPADTTSPVHQPHDMFFSRDVATNRMKMMGASSSACLTQTLNMYLRRTGVQPVSKHFEHGMRHAEELNIPLAISLPDFPRAEIREKYISIYFDRIHRLWPLFDIDATKSAIRQFASRAHLASTPREDVPALASAYLVMSLGADEQSSKLSRDGDLYLQAASSLMGHILFVPYLPAVQALLLLTIVFRGRNKDGLAWQTVGMAIRVAHSIGLHRHSVARPSQNHAITRKVEQLFHARIWGIACCLDKIMQIESGRPSPMGSVDKDQMMGPEQRPPGLDFLQWNMGIAEFQASISDHIYGYKQGERTSQQLLLETARLDKALLDWSNQLPPEFHPANELYCADTDFHIAAHLSIQYHQSMIALHRAALIAPTALYQNETERQCPHEPSKIRLKGGEIICVKSARSIARLMMELADRKADSRILTVGPAMLACIVLGIYITKNPANRMQAADLELLKACAMHVEDQYLKSGQDEVFAHGVVTIYEEVKKYINIVQNAVVNPGLAVTTNNSTNTNRPVSENQAKQNSVKDNTATLPRQEHHQNFRHMHNTSDTYSDTANAALNTWHIAPENVESTHNRSMSWNENVIDNGAQQELGFGPLPFNDYNVEELWDWMLWTDYSTSPLENLGGQSRWTYENPPDNN